METETLPSGSVVELTVILKDDEKTYKEKFLLYSQVTLDVEDGTVKACIAKAQESFRAIPEDIIIKASMTIQ